MTTLARTKLTLLPANELIKTGDVDHADWNYRPLLGTIARARFNLVRRLLPTSRVGRLLEIGYGSGIFFPELAKHADELHGIDVHTSTVEVADALRKHGIAATLTTAPAERIPYPDTFFDAVVCVSSLEFVDDVAQSAREISRTLKPDGRVVIVTPTEHPIFDLGLLLLTGKSAKDDFGDRRHGVINVFSRVLELDGSASFPPLRLPMLPPLYQAGRFRRRSADQAP